MWLDRLFSTVLFLRKPVFCEKHKSVEDMSKEETKQSQEIFCVLAYIRKRVMDPFYYNNPYPSTVTGALCGNLSALPWKSSMPWDQLEEEKDLVHLVYDIATYTLAALTKVCVFCEKSKNFSSWVNNTKEDTDLWHRMKDDCIDFRKALCSSQYQKILDEIYSLQSLTPKNSQFVETVFFVTFMIKYSVFSSESVESILASNQKIMEHTKKFTLEFPIGEDHLKSVEQLSQQLITLKGSEKESFNILLELVKQALLSLKHKEYKATEGYGCAIVGFVPSWCKGYFFLATAIYHNKGTHYAHHVASHAVAMCDKVECTSCAIFQALVKKWQRECGPSCHASIGNRLVADECNQFTEYKQKIFVEIRKKLRSEAEDLPDLTDPSCSDDSHSESDSDFDNDATQDEIFETNQPLPEVKPVKVDSTQDEVLEVNQLLPEVKPVKVDSSSFLLPNPPNLTSALRRFPPLVRVHEPWSESVILDKAVGVQKNGSLFKKPKNTAKKMEKGRQRKDSSHVILSAGEIKEKQEHLKILLKEGSAAITNGCGLSAVRNFHDALSELKSNPSIYEYPEYEIVCMKYAYGTACIKSGTWEDLNKAIGVFNEILNEHSNVRFPVAYYGLGLVHFKLNSFKEALSHFEMLQSILDKGIHFTVYSWPGEHHAIEETKTERLKVLLSDLIAKCLSPPEPAAVCRHENCLSRPEIYYSDPDFKGFTIIQCQDRCILQYHPACWKVLKDSFDRTDKDFLGQQCLTPDCEFTVTQIECIGKDGNTEKHFEIEDNEKAKKHKKSRLEKRLVMKEQKKRRRLESQNAQIPENPEVCDNSEVASETASNVSDQAAVKEVESSETIENEATRKVESNLSANAKPFYVKKDGEPLKENAKAYYLWKKDADSICENEKTERVAKTKERKKSRKPAVLSLEEFRQKIHDFSYFSEYEMRLNQLQQNKNVDKSQDTWSTICETESIPHLDPNRPFFIPEDIRDDPLALDAVLQSYSSFGKTDFSKILREKIYLHLEKILSFYGPMRVDDSVLLEEVSSFPGSFQQLISDAGGLKNFLLSSMRFAFVGDHICIVSDVVKAYSLGSKSYNGEGYSDAYERLDEYEVSNSNGVIDKDEYLSKNNKFHSLLNPHATEYNPYSPVQSKSSISSGNSNCSSETYQSDVNVKEVDQDSLTDSNSPLHSLSVTEQKDALSSNEQNSRDVPEANSVCDQYQLMPLDAVGDVSADNAFFADPHKAFERLSEDIKKLPRDKKFDMFLRVLKFVLNDNYFTEFISLFGHHIKPYTLTVMPKKYNKCVQAGTPGINMHSIGVMKEDDHVKAAIEKFQDFERYRNNINEEKKIVEEKLEHALDTIVQVQNALAVVERNQGKKVEEIQAVLEEEKKEFKKKEKNWEKEQKRLELNQAKMTEQLKICREELKKYKNELKKKDDQLKEIEELKKATEIDLENESKSKSEVEASLHEALQYHEVEVSSLTKKLQDAQLEIMTIKKNSGLEKLSVATANAELRLKEIQDGLPMVPPLYAEQLKSLQAQIKEYIIKLGKVHCDFVKAVDEQISELKKGKDLNDLPPLTEPECPALPNPTASVAHFSHPSVPDTKSLGSMIQPPNSSSVTSSNQTFNPLLSSFPQNLTPQAPNFGGSSVLGNLSSIGGSNVPSLNPYSMQNLNMMNSANKFDASVFSNSTSVYTPKPMPSFQPGLARAPMPPGLSAPMHPSSQGLPNSAQGSNLFHVPQTLQQNTSGNPPLLQTPFSFGFPQLHNRTALNPPGKPATKSVERSATEIAFLSAVKNAVSSVENKSVDHEAHSEKIASKDNTEIKRKISDVSSVDSALSAVEKGSQQNSACSSPVPVESSKDKSSVPNSARSTPVTCPELPVASKPDPPFVDLESTGVKLKKPKTNVKQKKINELPRSGASSVLSDYDSLNFDASVPDSAALELGYTVKENEEIPMAKAAPPSSSAGGFSRALIAPVAAQPKSVPATNSYEKLLLKLMGSYPQSSRAELIECVSEFRRNHNNKLSNLKFGSIITGIGEILERRKSNLAQAPQKKKPQLQVVSLTKKNAPVPPPPISEKSGICPWAKPEPSCAASAWNGESSDTMCSICLEEMTLKSSVKKLECGHRFHTACLKGWLVKNSNCPICRVHVLLPEDYPSLT